MRELAAYTKLSIPTIQGYLKFVSYRLIVESVGNGVPAKVMFGHHP